MKIGDVVKWSSQSNGKKTTKTGKIIIALHAGETPHVGPGGGLFVSNVNENGYRLKARGRVFNRERLSKGSYRDHKSYLIEVQDTPTGRPKLYWPRVNWLKPAKRRK